MEHICGFLSVTIYFSAKLLSHVPISNTWIVFCPVTIVIPLVTVVMHLVSVLLLNFVFLPKASLYNNI